MPRQEKLDAFLTVRVPRDELSVIREIALKDGRAMSRWAWVVCIKPKLDELKQAEGEK